jgi:Tfp pilus assembly protein PilN
MLLKSIESFIQNISFFFQRSIGIYFSEKNVEVVEVKKYFNKYKIINSKSYNFKDNFPDCIDNDLGFKNKLISINLNPEIAIYKLIRIPEMDESELENWIQDNMLSFLPAGISIQDVSIFYKVVKHNGDILMLLSILENAEIKRVNGIWDRSDFNLAIVSPGLIEWGILQNSGDKNRSGIFIKGREFGQVVIVQGTDLLYYNQIPAVFQENKDQPLYTTAYKLFEEDFKLLEFIPNDSNSKVFDENILDISMDYDEKSPAYSLALASFNHGKKSINYITSEFISRLDIFFWKRVFLKTIIGLGSISLILYLIIFLFSIFLSHFTIDNEAERASLIPHLAQISDLEKKRTVALKDLNDSESIVKFRSNKQQILTTISYHIPEGCWLYKVSTKENEESPYNTILNGMSKDRTIVHIFFGNLESDKNIKKIKLDHVNVIDAKDMYRNWKIRNRNYIDFQIALSF